MLPPEIVTVDFPKPKSFSLLYILFGSSVNAIFIIPTFEEWTSMSSGVRSPNGEWSFIFTPSMTIFPYPQFIFSFRSNTPSSNASANMNGFASEPGSYAFWNVMFL